MSDNLEIERLRQKVLTFGKGELELWKRSVIHDSGLFNQLFQFIFSDDERLAWRSCWIIDSASEDFPGLLSNKLTEIINGLLVTNKGSLKRHFTRILCRYPIPEEYVVPVIDRNLELLSPSEPVAVRVNAMQPASWTPLRLSRGTANKGCVFWHAQ